MFATSSRKLGLICSCLSIFVCAQIAPNLYPAIDQRDLFGKGRILTAAGPRTGRLRAQGESAFCAVPSWFSYFVLDGRQRFLACGEICVWQQVSDATRTFSAIRRIRRNFSPNALLRPRDSGCISARRSIASEALPIFHTWPSPKCFISNFLGRCRSCSLPGFTLVGHQSARLSPNRPHRR